VVHIVQNLAIGGLERVVLNLATHVDRARYRSSIVCLGPGGPLVAEAAGAGVDVHVVAASPRFHPGLVAHLARRFRRENVRVVHCHNAAPLVYGALAGRACRARVVYTAHGVKTSGSRMPVLLARAGFVDEFFTVSQDARRIAVTRAGADPRRVRTVVNGVDTARYTPLAAPARARRRAQLGIPEEAFAFVIVARLSPAKDHDNLLRAFASLADPERRLRLAVVGDGELGATLDRRVAELDLADRVLLLGSRADVVDWLGAFDCFVLSSYTEGLAMTLLEAMAAGLPVVATAVGGNAEVVADGETGRVVPARDSARLAEAMQWMVVHPDAAREMGRAGRRHAVERFSVQAMVGAYQAAYGNVRNRAC
jgi:glycosyltransferase involved in cell wall biosynthesis